MCSLSTNLAESTLLSVISFSAAEVSMRVNPLVSPTENHSTPMPMIRITQTIGVRRMRLKSMCVRGSGPRPSWSLSKVVRGSSQRADGGDDGTPQGGAAFSLVNDQQDGGVPAGVALLGVDRTAPTSGVDVRGEGADDPQVAVLLRVVEAVADDELVGDVEADVLHVHLHLGRLRLAQQGADLHRGRVAGLEVGLDPGQGQPGVDDVLDDQHVAAGDVGVEVLEDPHHA